MATKSFPTEDLIELAHGGGYDGYEMVEDQITSHRRWTIGHQMIFSYKGAHYSVHYESPATEYQDVEPFDTSGPTVECVEVAPVQVTTTMYAPV